MRSLIVCLIVLLLESALERSFVTNRESRNCFDADRAEREVEQMRRQEERGGEHVDFEELTCLSEV